jgi:hypothetical protein
MLTKVGSGLKDTLAGKVYLRKKVDYMFHDMVFC